MCVAAAGKGKLYVIIIQAIIKYPKQSKVIIGGRDNFTYKNNSIFDYIYTFVPQGSCPLYRDMP